MVTGTFEYRDVSGGPFPGPEPLPFFFFSYAVGGTTYESRTDLNGHFNLHWANPGDNVTFTLYSHNAVVRALDGFGLSMFTAPYSLTATANSIANGATVMMTVPAADQPVGIGFGAAIQLQRDYRQGLMEFAPFSNSPTPSGQFHSRLENDQIDVAMPGLPSISPHLPTLRAALLATNTAMGGPTSLANQINRIPNNVRAFTNPYPNGNPTIHFPSPPAALAHELGHALQFIRSSPLKRWNILLSYIPFLAGGGNHRFNLATNDFVAYLEAFATFADEYVHSKRTPLAGALPPPAATGPHTADHQLFFFRYRNYSPPPPAGPAALPPNGGFQIDNPAHFTPNDHASGTAVTAWSTPQTETLEGAIFSALFVEYASHVGLDFVVRSYIESQTMTMRELATWIRNVYGSNSHQYVELHRVMQRWNMYASDPIAAPAGYINAPIRQSEMGGLRNLTISEVPTQSNPIGGDVPPGAMRISWETDFRGYVQMAPMFDGWFQFQPDASAVLPATPADAVVANYARWNLTGKLLSFQIGARLQREMQADLDLQFIPDPPDRVSYEPIELTREFVFESLRQATQVTFSGGAGVAMPGAPVDLQQLTFDFLHGAAWIQLDGVSEIHDMPRIAKAGPGAGEEVFYITMASRSPLATNAGWWPTVPRDHAGIPWSGPGSPPDLVEPSLAYANAHQLDLRHPSHTIVPSWLVLSQLRDNAWQDDLSHPLVQAIRAARTDGRDYKRIDIERNWPVGIRVNDDMFARQFPMHQLVVESAAGNRYSSRLPASGRLYLAIEPDTYTAEVIPRWQTAASIGTGANSMRLAEITNTTPAEVFTDQLNIDLQANDWVNLLSGQPEYDGAVAWELARDAVTIGVFARSVNRRATGLGLRTTDIHSAIIPIQFAGGVQNYFESHREIYGHVIESAARHDVYPELVLAMLLSPALLGRLFPTGITAPVPYVAHQTIHGDEVGLLAVGDNMGGHTLAGGLAAGFSFDRLVAENWIDASFVPAASLQNFRTLTAGPGTGHQTADIVGWQATIELIAATLQAGLIEMENTYHSLPPAGITSPCGANGNAFHPPNDRPLSVGGELVLAIAAYFMEGPISHAEIGHSLSCLIDPASHNARPWNVTTGAGALRYPSGPADTTFTDFQHLQFDILRQLATTLVLLDCEAWR